MSISNTTTAKKVWDYLYSKIGNKYGVAGLMGNLYAESGMIFNRVEILCLQRIREYYGITYTDKTYTEAVDSGKISRERFLHPLPNKQYGYSLWQLTSPNRKAGLYDLCKSRGVSIANEQAQLDYLMIELEESYSTVLSTLKNAKSIKEASDIVLKRFECPADTGTSMQNTRASYGQQYYNLYANSTAPSSQTVQTTIAESMAKKYVTNNGTHYISNSGSDERGGYYGGQAGDQTGNEWCLRSWYSRPWNCVIRAKRDDVRNLLAELAVRAALNNNIGYDQYQRDTYWNQLKANGFNPSLITMPCESDCSAGVIANAKAVGYLLRIESLKSLTATYTGNMRTCFSFTKEFEILTSSKYTSGCGYLLPGDILLNDAAHTATNITIGANVSYSFSLDVSLTVAQTTVSSTNLSVGSTGSAVTEMQKMLIACGYSCGSAGADGDFGNGTKNAVISFQKAHNLSADGIYGPMTKSALESAYKSLRTPSTPTSTSGKLNETVKWNGRVTADKLNVRTYAGTEYGTCSFSPLVQNTVVGVCDSVKAKNGVVWYFIKHNGKYGFVSGEYITKVAEAIQQPSATKPTTTSTNKVIAKAKEIADYMIANKFVYNNSNVIKNWAKAKVASRKVSNCALYATWVLQELGYCEKDKQFYFDANGNAKGSGWDSVKKACSVTTYKGVSIDKVSLQDGDIVCYGGHVNIYAGKNSAGNKTWLDAGRGGTEKCVVDSKFTKNMYQTWNNAAYKVYAVIRVK